MAETIDLMNEMYKKNFRDVYHYLLRFTRSKTDAEDLTQDTFIKVINNHDSFLHKSSVKTWIFTIAKRTALDHYRKNKTCLVFPENSLELCVSNYGLPEKELDFLEDWSVFKTAIKKLKPEDRKLVILRGLKEYSVKDTAGIMNWNEAKVKVRYHRVIKFLRKEVS
ncbi:RNA polymerase sigma factor [Neobacillus sp. NRS-1170]|uniref:RNA polymerase sigma factor n=1 Tax=Neobacillus sp. NRS-1170 TaxID=3233898 RepID=UPI003D2DA646